jgi:hypothetical protein
VSSEPGAGHWAASRLPSLILKVRTCRASARGRPPDRGPKLLCWNSHCLRGERPHATAVGRKNSIRGDPAGGVIGGCPLSKLAIECRDPLVETTPLRTLVPRSVAASATQDRLIQPAESPAAALELVPALRCCDAAPAGLQLDDQGLGRAMDEGGSGNRWLTIAIQSCSCYVLDESSGWKPLFSMPTWTPSGSIGSAPLPIRTLISVSLPAPPWPPPRRGFSLRCWPTVRDL